VVVALLSAVVVAAAAAIIPAIIAASRPPVVAFAALPSAALILALTVLRFAALIPVARGGDALLLPLAAIFAADGCALARA
jgi:hypothetical protein